MTSSLIKEKLLQRGPKQALQNSFVFLRAPRLEACAAGRGQRASAKIAVGAVAGLSQEGMDRIVCCCFSKSSARPSQARARGIFSTKLTFPRAVRESLVTGNGAPSHHGNTNLRYFYTKLARRRPLIRGREERRIMVESIRPGDLGSLVAGSRTTYSKGHANGRLTTALQHAFCSREL
jgi:hypothetical protein